MSLSQIVGGIMSILGDIELIKMSAVSASLTPKTITFNQNGWDKFVDFSISLGCGFVPTRFSRCHSVSGLVVHFDMKQEEDFILGVV
jgi:hypothetical protein